MALSWCWNLEKWQRCLTDASRILELTKEQQNYDVYLAVHIAQSDEWNPP